MLKRTHEVALGRQRDRVVLNGVYSPEGYFEGPESWECERFSVFIANGKIEVRIKNPECLPDQSERQSIISEIRNHFEAQRILNRTDFEFNGLEMIRYRDGDKKDIFADVTESLVVKVKCGVADFRITDKDGNVVRDTKAERLAYNNRFRELCRKHRGNPLVRKLCASYGEAVKDQKNMFIHLYEVLDALKHLFNGVETARSRLNISRNDWEKVAIPANNKPLKEGRHRGQYAVLREATDEEKEMALRITTDIIFKYLNFLEKP